MPAIKLTVVEHVIDNVGGVPVGRILYRASDAVDVPDDKWFLVRRETEDRLQLVCVASPADFVNFPTTP